MNKSEWIEQAYDRFIQRGVHADEKTWDWAESLYQCAIDDSQGPYGFDMPTPEDAVDEELYAAVN